MRGPRGSNVSEEPTQSTTWFLSVALAALGGFLAAVGVFLPWASATGVRTSEIFGTETVGTYTSSGSGDLTGMIVVGAGLVVGVLAVGALLFKGSGLRRLIGTVALAGGLVILVACAVAVFRPEAVLGDLPPELAEPSVTVQTSVAAGLFVSVAGAVLAGAGGLVARRSTPPK